MKLLDQDINIVGALSGIELVALLRILPPIRFITRTLKAALFPSLSEENVVFLLAPPLTLRRRTGGLVHLLYLRDASVSVLKDSDL